MTSTRFLPYVRRGFGAGAADPLRGPLPVSASLRSTVALTDSNATVIASEHVADVAGPGDVIGIDAAQIIRYEPAPGTSDFETNYLPFVELVAPDLPWMLTPATPGSQQALRPWLVLVVVEESESVRFEETGFGAVLEVDAISVATELWDLADAAFWVHAQTTAADSEAAVQTGSGQVIARLMCPRKLQVGRRYLAALVPAFDAGVAAGLGQPTTATQLQPAWDVDVPVDLALPVYASWTFSTSDQPGDFESLAKRLQPDLDGGRMGFHAARLDPGGLLPDVPGNLELGFEFAGALTDPAGTPEPMSKQTQQWLDKQLGAAIERGSDRIDIDAKPPENYVPERDDPVLAPPLYGQWAADAHTISKEGWMREVNLDMSERAAAGLGAEVVQRNEHDFLASAWDQVGALREAKIEVNRTRLIAEIADRQLDKLAPLDDATLLFAAGKITAKVTVDRVGETAAQVVKASPTVPTAVVSAAFFRGTRQASTVGRAVRAASPGSARPVARRIANRFVTASQPVRPAGADIRVGSFKSSFVPDGAVVVGQALRPAEVVDDPAAEAADAVRSARPSASAYARLAGRIDGVNIGRTAKQVQKAGGRAISSESTTHIIVGPWFPDGIAPYLQAMSPELLLPGVGEFGRDRVRLLEINESFVASILIGANHEWAREALWREFPADLAATAFASLFDRPGDPPAPGPDTDLNTELAAAGLDRSLDDLIGGAGTGTVLLIRAELVRRFPGLVVSLLSPLDGSVPLSKDGGELIPKHVHVPMFVGQIDPSTIFVGFDVDPSVVLDEKWYVSVEEPPSGPRFGFDAGGHKEGAERGDAPPDSWNDVTWAHLRGDRAETHLRMSEIGWGGVERDGVEWGRNGAHQARIALQQPYRMVFPAAALIGGRR